MWRSSGGMTLREALNEDFGRVTTAMALLWLLAAVVVAAVFQRGEDVVRELPWRVAALVVGRGLIRTTGMTPTPTGPDRTGSRRRVPPLCGISAWVGRPDGHDRCACSPGATSPSWSAIVPKFSTIAAVSVLVSSPRG